jgi:hypothetical protein
MPQKRSAATRPVAATVRGLAGREDTTDVALPNRSSERDTSLTLTTSTPTYIRFLSPGMRFGWCKQVAGGHAGFRLVSVLMAMSYG